MASFGHTFDASTVEPTTAYEVLPPGKYNVQVVASEMRPTKDGLGQYLFLELDILEGQHAGRKLFDRLNLVNANQDTVQMAQRSLSALCRAAGKMQVSNSEQLHLIPIFIDVKVKPPKGQYGESNSIRYLAESTPPAAQPFATPARTATQAALAAPASSASLPWKRQG
jgi:hypothetical protein